MGVHGHLGLREITPTLKTGDFYFRLGKYDSAASCKRTIDKVPHLGSGDTYATLYAPLEKTPFTPHVIMIVMTPRNIAQTRPEFSLPLGRENLRRVLRYPVSLFRYNGPDLSNRTTELLARV